MNDLFAFIEKDKKKPDAEKEALLEIVKIAKELVRDIENINNGRNCGKCLTMPQRAYWRLRDRLKLY